MALTKADNRTHLELSDALAAKKAALELAIDAYNQTMAAAWIGVEQAIADYNGAVSDAENFRDEMYTEMESFFDGKSEEWQEGEKGEAYAEWKDAWSAPLDEIAVDEPDAMEMPDVEYDAFSELPDET